MIHRSILPMSITALIKRIPNPVHGYHAFELTDEIIRKAHIFIMDVHWHLSLAGAQRLAARIKKINPHAILIAGGVTASLYPRQIVDRLDFDYVVRGDAEIPLQQLVKALLDGQSLEHIPNLIGKDGFKTPWTYALTENDLNENDYLDLSFFPTAQKEILMDHAANPHPKWPVPLYPYLIPFRGCPVKCDTCAGAFDQQRRLFRRAPVIRSADRIADDLARMDADPNIRFVNALWDFLVLGEEYAKEALGKPTNLWLFYSLFRIPEKKDLELLLSRFSGGCVMVSADNQHITSDIPADPDEIIDRIKLIGKAGDFTPILFYNGIFAKSSPDYKKVVETVRRATRCYLADESHWWAEFPRPDENGSADETTFDRFLSPKPAQRFPILNLLAQSAGHLGRILPSQWSNALLSVWYRYVQYFLLKAK